MKKITLLKSLLIVLAMSFFSVVALAQATTVGTYKKVTEAPANGDWSGQYLIVAESDTEFFIQDGSTYNGTGGAGKVAPWINNLCVFSKENGTIEVTQAVMDRALQDIVDAKMNASYYANGNFHFTIDKDGHVILATEAAMGSGTTNGSIAADKTLTATNTISLRADGSAQLASKNGSDTRYLWWIIKSKKFSYYAVTSAGTTYYPVYLYKLVTDEGGEEGGDVVEPEDPETPVEPEDPETPVEPEEPIVGAKLYFDVSLASTYKNVPVVFSNETATDTVAMVAVEGQTNVFEVEVPAGNWSQITLVKKNMNYVLKNYDGVNNLFKSYPATAFYSATAPTDGDGVWMKYGENFAVGSNIMPKQVVYFDPAVFGDACDSYDVVFVQTGNKAVTKVAANKLADGKYYATAGSYVYTGFSIRGYKNKQFVASASNLTWDGTGKLYTIGTGTWSTEYTEPERVMTAEWNMEGLTDGKTEGFSSVQVTFSGIDPQGRLLGDGATEVVYAGTAATFYKLEGETRTEVATLSGASNGVLTAAKVNNFTWEFSIGEAFESFEKGYMREGNYCIVINGANLTINPKVSNKAVEGSGEFVLNFTIDNEKVFLEPTAMEYELTPAKSVVSEISEVIVNFTDESVESVDLVSRATGRSTTPDPKTCAYIRGAGIEYPMNCEVLKDGYSIALTIASEYTGGVDKITADGLYTITIPEGMLSFNGSNVIVNQEITLTYTVGTAMPANSVIYFDPAGKQAEKLSVRFTAANGEVKEADVMNIAGGLYRIEMPAGDEWMRFEIVAKGDDPATPESNIVDLYSVSNLVYDGTNNLFTLNADAPVEATAVNGVWSKHTVQQIQGGEAFYYNIASSVWFVENQATTVWRVLFMNAAGDEVAVEMELVEAGLYKMVAPEGTWDMFKIVLDRITASGDVRENWINVYFEYDGVHNMFKLAENATSEALVGTLDVYAAPVVVVAPAAPTFSVAEGEFEEEFILEILPAKDEERDVVILFTTDGTEPNAGVLIVEKGTTGMYREGVRISETTTVKAMVVLYDENIENAADFVVSPVTTATYTKKEVAPRVVTAEWSIQEGAILESFTGVTVTFSGIDPLGRKVDGTEVTKVFPVISSVPTFFLVNEDGTTTQVVADEDTTYSGVLTCSVNGVTSTLSLGTSRYALVDGAFLKNGNYRIVLPANKVQYQPKVDNAPVYGDKDFVLNFSIVNDYVEPEKPEEPVLTEIEVPFTVSVENNSTVAELSEIVITYPDVARIKVSEPVPPKSPATWVCLSQTLVDETGNVTASNPMVLLYWKQVSVNSFKVMVNLSAIGGPETLAIEGTYSIDVPAGLVMFSETEVNKAFSLYYTIEKGEDGPIVNVENVILSDIFVQEGTIVAEGEFQIFTITGQNVTRMNGNLQSGVYVVRCGNATAKVVVK